MNDVIYFWGYSESLDGLEIVHLPDDERRVAFIMRIHEALRDDLFYRGVFSCIGHYLVQDAENYCWIFATESEAFAFARSKMGVVSFYTPFLFSDVSKEEARHAL